MKKRTILITALLAIACATSAVVISKTGDLSTAFGVKGDTSTEKSITFSGTAISLGSKRYSTAATSSDGNTFYLICETTNAPSSGQILTFPNSSASSFYFSEYQTGKDGDGNVSYMKFQGITSLTFTVSGSTAVEYWSSSTSTFSSTSTAKVTVKSAEPTITLSSPAKYMKFKGNGTLYDTTCSSLTVNYTCTYGPQTETATFTATGFSSNVITMVIEDFGGTSGSGTYTYKSKVFSFTWTTSDQTNYTFTKVGTYTELDYTTAGWYNLFTSTINTNTGAYSSSGMKIQTYQSNSSAGYEKTLVKQ